MRPSLPWIWSCMFAFFTLPRLCSRFHPRAQPLRISVWSSAGIAVIFPRLCSILAVSCQRHFPGR